MSARPTVQGLPEALQGTQVSQLVESLPDAVVCDMYDPRGSVVYDDFTSMNSHEVHEVLRMVRATQGRILELAAGSGRVTLPLLTLGREVVAVDLSDSMLRLLSERISRLPQKMQQLCSPVRGDITSYELKEPAAVAVLPTTSVSLLSDVQRLEMLRTTRNNLEAGGTFLLTTYQLNSEVDDLSERVIHAAGVSGTEYQLHDIVTPDRRGRYSVVIGPETEQGQTVCHSYIRIIPANTLKADLENSGFLVEDLRIQSLAGEPRYANVFIRARKGDR
ncbi:daptide-type RiPP biosynthesis methyltransferase [Streptomyces sp. NPDC056534]|uniref:daptide-type RiPP biosynthesis methyltransferase n=1 Tax=Streptomyces sp. NPDC056534 TaxID=3345857 RepID=UPI0036A36635